MGALTKNQLTFDTTDIAESDNIGAFLRGAGGTVITSTTIGSDEALDVNVAGSSTAHAEDTAHTSGDEGNMILAVRQDAAGSLVDADGDYAPLQVDANGRLRVDAEVSVATGSDKAEDSAHVSGDIGSYMLSVREDVLATSTSADGDYQSLKTDNLGRLWTIAQVAGDVADDAADSGNPLKVGGRAHDTSAVLDAVSADNDRADLTTDLYRRVMINDSPNIGVQVAAVSVDNTVGGTQLVAAALGGRRRMVIQNLGGKNVAIGASGVTFTSGLIVPRRSQITLEIGEAIDLYAIANVGAGQDIRVFELA